MALGSPSQSIGPINPAALIGQATPVVEPRATAALADAFRSGMITADEIIARASPERKLRQKAEIQALQEQLSPEAITARTQARQAAAAQAELQSAQALAQTPLAAPAGQLAATQLEEQQAIQKYGPGIEYFKSLAPEAGIAAPVTGDGQPDYAKRAEIGLRLFEWKQQRERAKERLTPAHWEKSPDGTQLFKFNKQGELITPELEQSLVQQAIGKFTDVAPGAAITAPTTTPAVSEIEVTPQQRAQVVEQIGIAPEQAARLTGAQISQLVQPKPEAIATPTVSVPGATVFLGPAKAPQQKAPVEAPRAAAEELGAIEADRTAIQSARQLLTQANVVGPGAGSIGVQTLNQVGAALGIRAQQFESQDRLLQLVNKRVLEGAQKLKGNLSDKDIRFLKESYPKLTSTETVWNDFLGKWEQMLNLNEQIIRGTAPKGSSIFDVAQPAAAPFTTSAGSSGGVLQLPSTGRQIIRDANGTYRLVQ